MKFSGIVPNNIIYHLKWFEQNRYCSFWEMVQKPPKNTVFLTWIIQKIFFRKKLSSVSCPYSKEHSCQKAKKSLARFSVTFANGLRTNQHSQAWPQLKLRTATFLTNESHQREDWTWLFQTFWLLSVLDFFTRQIWLIWYYHVFQIWNRTY